MNLIFKKKAVALKSDRSGLVAKFYFVLEMTLTDSLMYLRLVPDL